MEYTYDESGSTSKDQLRLMLFDTDISNAVWADEELDSFITMSNSNLNIAASKAIRSLTFQKGKSAVMYRLAENLRVDKRELPRILMQLARDFEKAANRDPAAIVEFIDAFAVKYDEDTGEDESIYVTNPNY